MTCRACGSSRTVYDRTLAGREVCLDCGAAQGRFLNQRPRQRSACRQATHRRRWPIQPLLGLTGVGAALLAWVSPLPFPLRPGDRLLQSPTPAATDDPLAARIRRHPLSRTLMAQGVQIVIGPGRPPGSRHCRYACWIPQSGTLYINRLTHRNDSATLRHEATHVAQSCRAGGLRTEAVPLGLTLTPADRQAFTPLADFYRRKGERDLTTELEAFRMQTRTSTRAAIALVQQECGRLPYLPLSVQARNLTQPAIQRLKAPSETPRNP